MIKKMKLRNLINTVAICLTFSGANGTLAQTAMNRSALYQQNNTKITPNGVGAITGAVLNSMLGNMIASMMTIIDNALFPVYEPTSPNTPNCNTAVSSAAATSGLTINLPGVISGGCTIIATVANSHAITINAAGGQTIAEPTGPSGGGALVTTMTIPNNSDNVILTLDTTNQRWILDGTAQTTNPFVGRQAYPYGANGTTIAPATGLTSGHAIPWLDGTSVWTPASAYGVVYVASDPQTVGIPGASIGALSPGQTFKLTFSSSGLVGSPVSTTSFTWNGTDTQAQVAVKLCNAVLANTTLANPATGLPIICDSSIGPNVINIAWDVGIAPVTITSTGTGTINLPSVGNRDSVDGVTYLFNHYIPGHGVVNGEQGACLQSQYDGENIILICGTITSASTGGSGFDLISLTGGVQTPQMRVANGVSLWDAVGNPSTLMGVGFFNTPSTGGYDLGGNPLAIASGTFALGNNLFGGVGAGNALNLQDNAAGSNGFVQISVNGAVREKWFLTGGATMGTPTGGDEGAATLNVAGGLFINGVAVSGAVNPGTSGQIAYYATTGSAVSGTTTGTGVLTAIGDNVNSAGGFLTSPLPTLTFGTHLVSGASSYNGTSIATLTSDATNANTASTIVARDPSGNFAATTITAALTGHASLDLAISALGTGVQTALGNGVNTSGGVLTLPLPTLTFGTHLASGAASYNGSAIATITSDAASANTASTIVARDGSGNFTAGTITASLTGHSSLDCLLTTCTMTGQLIVQYGSPNFTLQDTGTSYAFFQIISQNGSGGSMRIGTEGSVGGSLLTGDTANSGVMGTTTNNPVQFGTNGSVKMTLSAAGGLSVGTAADPGVGSLQLNAQEFVPNITTSSAAQTGTVCWTTGTGKFTVDTTVGCLTSLEEFKDKHGPIEGAMAEIGRLDPFWYTWRHGTPEWDGGDRAEQPGLGAHQVESVDRRLVGYATDGRLSGVRYTQIVALLIAGMKELKADNDNLKREIADLRHASR